VRCKSHFPKKNRENDKKRLWFQDKNKNFFTHYGKSGHWIENFWKLLPQLCPNQNQEDVKALTMRQVAASIEIGNVVEKFEKELFLMACLSSIVHEDIEVWFVYTGLSRHMTRMMSIFLTFSEINKDCYVRYGTNTRHAVTRFGCVIF